MFGMRLLEGAHQDKPSRRVFDRKLQEVYGGGEQAVKRRPDESKIRSGTDPPSEMKDHLRLGVTDERLGLVEILQRTSPPSNASAPRVPVHPGHRVHLRASLDERLTQVAAEKPARAGHQHANP